MIENRFSKTAPVKVAGTDEEEALIRVSGARQMPVHRKQRLVGFFLFHADH
jgi:hypothetical protein